MEEQPVGANARLVVIGASAGGIEALNQLASTLPTPFAAPIVIAQHLDPTVTSHLHSILERATTMEIRTVGDESPLENGVIYVVPANRDVEVDDHRVSLQGDSEGRSKPSVDRLFRSAAEAFGEDLIAVILTGSGSDGADGARAVKEHGGTVIIQNPETASHPGMPLSLAPNTVDITADLPAIGPLLHDILTGGYTPPPPEENREMRMLLEQLRQQSGIDFSQYRQSTIQRRLQRRMADTGTMGVEAYLRYLQRHPEEYERLVATFLIKVTNFFRDAELFDYLRARIVPDVIAAARSQGNELRLWSAGCATGEEAYSLAILVAEALGDQIDKFQVRIFATDLDGKAVAFARRGLYPASSLQGVPQEIIERYFSVVDGAYEVQKSVRSLLVFGQHDLGQRAPFPRTELVLCRNVLIYFTPELQRRALQLFSFSLRPGARLVLGKSESTNPLPEYFALEQPRLRVYRRQGERILISAGSSADVISSPQHAVQSRAAQLGRERHRARSQLLEFARGERPLGNPAEMALLNLQTGVLVVDEHYDVLSINLAARRLLGIHGTAVGDDVIRLARIVPSEVLLRLIDAARSGERPEEIISVRSSARARGQTRALELRCYRQTTEGDDAGASAVIVEVTDATSLVRSQAEAERFRTGLEDAQRTVTEVLADNEQLSRNNGILRNQNDELLVGAEEAQAAAEEVETLNEEQQATNEELETLNEELEATNEELQATNEELEKLNDDLQSRSAELVELAATREAARMQLSAILSSMTDAVVAVDRDGNLLLVNDAFERLFGADGSGLQPEDEDGSPFAPDETPRQRAARGEHFTMHFTSRDGEEKRRWFEAVGQPVKASSAEAGMVTIRDITERNLRRLQSQFIAAAAHELRTPLTVMEGSLQILERRLSGLPPERVREYIGMSLHQARRLRVLTEELVDVERLELGQMRVVRERVDLADVVRQSITAVQSLSENQSIALGSFKGEIPVAGDVGRLEQVFLNLLTNAVLHAAESNRVDVRMARRESVAEVEIEDYGHGIPPEHLPHIFDRFYQSGQPAGASGSGLGLGLFICHEIVLAHQGSIEARSELGKGTTFTVRLPILIEDSRESGRSDNA